MNLRIKEQYLGYQSLADIKKIQQYDYIYGSLKDEMVANVNPDGCKTYYHNDHLGSATVLTDQSGAVVEKSSYEPYGEIKQGGTKSKFGYTGQEKDSETGLNYYDARYYDPHLQRFAQPDDVIADVYNPQHLNRYSYVNNNPMTYNDPSGHCPVCFIVGGVGALIGLGAQYLTNPNSSLQEYSKSAGIGFVAGFAAPITESTVAGAAIRTLATTSLSVTARTAIGDTVATSITSLGTNSFQNWANGRDITSNLPSSVGIDMLTYPITRGIVPSMQGRTPSLLDPVAIGTNSERQIEKQGLGVIMSNFTINFLNNSGTDSQSTPKYEFDNKKATYFKNANN